MNEITAIFALSTLKGINTNQKRALLDEGYAIADLITGKIRHPDPFISAQILSLQGFEKIERDLARLEKEEVQAITLRDPRYPSMLKNIPDAPVVLYLKGSLTISDKTIAIVGSRNATAEGIAIAEKIAETLSSEGVLVVSGFARGIDSAAHRGALKGPGKTVAVLGSGIDICYPSENRELFDRISRDGVIVTEYGPGERPLRHHFPERNRIIAGLSRGVVVIEATEKSGSLITARLAADYGREVMAIPGSVLSDRHRGANSLIKSGAKLVDSVDDILMTSFPGITIHQFKQKEIDMDAEEDYIYSFIGKEMVHIDDIIEQSRAEVKKVGAVLTKLEMKDAIVQHPGGFYTRRQ